MPEKDLVPHNVEQDTVQIYLSEEQGLILSFKRFPLRGSTHVSLSLSLALSLCVSSGLLSEYPHMSVSLSLSVSLLLLILMNSHDFFSRL